MKYIRNYKNIEGKEVVFSPKVYPNKHGELLLRCIFVRQDNDGYEFELAIILYDRAKHGGIYNVLTFVQVFLSDSFCSDSDFSDVKLTLNTDYDSNRFGNLFRRLSNSNHSSNKFNRFLKLQEIKTINRFLISVMDLLTDYHDATEELLETKIELDI